MADQVATSQAPAPQNTGTALPSPGPLQRTGGTVREAAGLIEGLMTDDGSLSSAPTRPRKPAKQASPADPVEPTVDDLDDTGETDDQGGTPDADTSDEGTESTDQSDEQTPDTDDAEGTDENDPDHDIKARKFKLVENGQEIEVTLDELKKGHLRQRDYTRKTEELANVRKVVESEHGTVRQNREALDSLLVTAFEATRALFPTEPDWTELSKDPAKYAQVQAAWNGYQQKLAAINADRQRNFEAMRQQDEVHLKAFLADEAKKVIERIPELKDPAKAKAVADRWRKYGAQVGFSEAELKSVRDSRMLEVLDKASRYDELVSKAKQRASKGTGQADTPRVRTAAPGSANSAPRPSSRAERDMKQFKRSGKVSDAAKALEHLI